MAWENIEERLKKPFAIEQSHPEGTVWFPNGHLEIDEWLSSIAQTDEELKELDIRRIRFLQNRWPVEKLLQLEWDDPVYRRMILAMYVGHRAYILFFDGFTYQVLGALEPRDKPELYPLIIDQALRNAQLVPTPPKQILIRRPDFLSSNELADLQHHHESIPHLEVEHASKKSSYLANLLVGWVGNWIELPVVGYWHEDSSEAEGNFERKNIA